MGFGGRTGIPELRDITGDLIYEGWYFDTISDNLFYCKLTPRNPYDNFVEAIGIADAKYKFHAKTVNQWKRIDDINDYVSRVKEEIEWVKRKVSEQSRQKDSKMKSKIIVIDDTKIPF